MILVPTITGMIAGWLLNRPLWIVAGFLYAFIVGYFVVDGKVFEPVRLSPNGIRFKNREYQRLFEEANPAHFKAKESELFKPPSTLFPQ